MARRPEWVKVVETNAGRRYEVRVHGSRQDGSRFQHRKRFTTVEAAVKWRSTVVSELAHGTHVAPSELTVRAAVDEWLRGQRIAAKTRSSYITNLRAFVDAYGDRTVQSITKADIEDLVQLLQEGGLPLGTWNGPKKLKGKQVRDPWGPSSINPCLSRTRSVFADLQAQGIVPRNPAALVKGLPKTPPVINPLTREQVLALLAATAADPFQIGWRLAVGGLRRGEILGLRWDAVDFTANTLTVRVSRAPVSGGVADGTVKTTSSLRELPLPPDLAAALKRERKRQREARLQLGSKWVNTAGRVVVDEFGVSPHPDAFGKRWHKALKAAGLPPVRLHDARHTCATLLHHDGVPAADVAAWLGHVNAAFTLAVYTHSSKTTLGAAAARLGTITSGPSETPEAASEPS